MKSEPVAPAPMPRADLFALLQAFYEALLDGIPAVQVKFALEGNRPVRVKVTCECAADVREMARNRLQDGGRFARVWRESFPKNEHVWRDPKVTVEGFEVSNKIALLMRSVTDE